MKKNSLQLGIILMIACLIVHFDGYGQNFLLGNNIIRADPKVDSIFRQNFRKLESFKQSFIIRDPGFSMFDFNEPHDNEVYKFVEFLVEVTGIKCDSIIKQKNWTHEYCTWNDKKIEDWELWYFKYGKNLKREEIFKIMNEIDKNWTE